MKKRTLFLLLLLLGSVTPNAGAQSPAEASAKEATVRSLDEQERLAVLNRDFGALRAGGIEATAVLIQGPIAGTILTEATRLDAELIVMGTHGRSAVFDLVVGSVSHAVLRDSTIPVLFVPLRSR